MILSNYLIFLLFFDFFAVFLIFFERGRDFARLDFVRVTGVIGFGVLFYV